MVFEIKDAPFGHIMFTGKIQPTEIDDFHDWMKEYRNYGFALGHVFYNCDFIVVIREAALAFAFRLRWS